jgi:hypothetical protein
MSQQFKAFATSLRIKLVNSTPYYAQSNGQAEASNKILIKLIKKKIDEHPRRWHEVLSEALWAHWVSRQKATKTTPFELVYRQEAVLPVEVNLQACWVARQNDLSAKEYTNLMMDRLDEAEESHFEAMIEIEKEKLQTTKAYNKKVREKSFQIRDLVWKMILPLKAWDNKFGKWSLSWEGPYRVVGIVPRNMYFMEDLEGKGLAKALNGKYLKRYYPSIWQGAWRPTIRDHHARGGHLWGEEIWGQLM